MLNAVYCSVAAAATVIKDDSSSVSQIVHVVNPVNDEAIAMAALSSMADSISSSHLAPASEQITASTQQICSEQVTGYSEQMSSEQLTEHSGDLTETLQMAIDLSSANIDHLT